MHYSSSSSLTAESQITKSSQVGYSLGGSGPGTEITPRAAAAASAIRREHLRKNRPHSNCPVFEEINGFTTEGQSVSALNEEDDQTEGNSSHIHSHAAVDGTHSQITVASPNHCSPTNKAELAIPQALLLQAASMANCFIAGNQNASLDSQLYTSDPQMLSHPRNPVAFYNELLYNNALQGNSVELANEAALAMQASMAYQGMFLASEASSAPSHLSHSTAFDPRNVSYNAAQNRFACMPRYNAFGSDVGLAFENPSRGSFGNTHMVADIFSCRNSNAMHNDSFNNPPYRTFPQFLAHLPAAIPQQASSLATAAAAHMLAANACIASLASIANPEGTKEYAGSTQRQLVNANFFPMQADLQSYSMLIPSVPSAPMRTQYEPSPNPFVQPTEPNPFLPNPFIQRTGINLFTSPADASPFHHHGVPE